MFQNQRILIAIIVLVIVIIVIGGAWWWFGRSEAAGDAVSDVSDSTQGVVSYADGSSPPVQDRSVVDVPLQEGDKTLMAGKPAQIARDIVERLGSYSTEAAFANVEAALSLMTDEYRRASETLIARGRANPPAEAQNVITRAFTVTVSEEDGARAVVRVQTQRNEEKAGQMRMYHQEALVTLEQVQGEWKANSVEWGTEEQ